MWVLLTALVPGAAAIGTFLCIKLINDPLIVGVSVGGMALIFSAERRFLQLEVASNDTEN